MPWNSHGHQIKPRQESFPYPCPGVFPLQLTKFLLCVFEVCLPWVAYRIPQKLEGVVFQAFAVEMKRRNLKPGPKEGFAVDRAVFKRRAEQSQVMTNILAEKFHLTFPVLSSKNTLSQPYQERRISDVVRIGNIIISYLSKLWRVKFFIHRLCDAIFLVRLQEKFEIDHSWKWKG